MHRGTEETGKDLEREEKQPLVDATYRSLQLT